MDPNQFCRCLEGLSGVTCGQFKIFFVQNELKPGKIIQMARPHTSYILHRLQARVRVYSVTFYLWFHVGLHLPV